MNVSIVICRCLLVATLAFPSGKLFAGVVAVWQGETQGQLTTNTLRIQGSRYWVDLSPALSMFLDLEPGHAYTIVHAAKSYIREPLTNFHQGSPCGDLAGRQPVATGRTRSIGGYEAQELRVSGSCGEHAWWVAQEYPDWQRFQKESAVAAARLSGKPGVMLLSNLVTGMIVANETITRVVHSTGAVELRTNTSRLVSAAVTPDDPALTKVPDGYREVRFAAQAPQTNEFMKRFLAESDADPRWRSSNAMPTGGSLFGKFSPGEGPKNTSGAASAVDPAPVGASGGATLARGDATVSRVFWDGQQGRARRVAPTDPVPGSWASEVAARRNHATTNQSAAISGVITGVRMTGPANTNDTSRKPLPPDSPK